MDAASHTAFYTDTSEKALELKARLEEGGFTVTSVAATDLAKEGLAFASREVFRVEVAPEKFAEAIEYVSSAAAELLAAAEELPTGVLGVLGPPAITPIPAMEGEGTTCSGQASRWEQDRASWIGSNKASGGLTGPATPSLS